MTRRPLPRPTLLPGLARLWRDRHTLQLGLDPGRAVLLEVADPGAARLLDLFDGAHSERAILEHASRIRVDRDHARTLIDTLRDAGLVVSAHTLLPYDLPESARQRLWSEAGALALRGARAAATPAQALRRRAAARIVVTGQGRLAPPVAIALAQAGVGHIHPDLAGQVEPVDAAGGGLLATDVRRPRADAVAEAIRRVAPGTETRPVRRGAASLVVQVGADRPAELLAAAYAQRRQPHLLLGLRDGVPVIGPLVRAGQPHLLLGLRDGVPVIGPLVRASGTPCLNCLDLHRQDRDPGWPGLAAQLAAGQGPQPCATATLIAAVGYALGQVLGFLDGGRAEVEGGSAEVTGPGEIRRRFWPPHPACRCGRRRG
ncbi:hypothetical protein AB0J86_21990 [Micromonospora sp. NPDC049559]|uniref:hypothetical protein n=1 Tax=Micromonospora sp. NPDC049559 TaxID=3155923 RepID=UPI003434142F